MNKKVYILLAIAAIAVVAIWMLSKAPVSKAPEGARVAPSDSTASINKDLNGVNVESANFQSIDADLNSL